MDEFLIDCSFKSYRYSMAPKFDQLIQRYGILIPSYMTYCGIMATGYVALGMIMIMDAKDTDLAGQNLLSLFKFKVKCSRSKQRNQTYRY
jgi:hypothetical protein